MKEISKIRRKVSSIIKRPQSLYIKIIHFLSPILGDEIYIKLLFRYRAGYRLHLKSPQTFNEKLQWLKLYYRRSELTHLVDKYEVKNYVRNLIGEDYIIPTLGVWDSYDEINFEQLPNRFVLKTTHDQGGVVICTDKATFNYKKAEEKLKKHLKRNFFLKYREWPYKNVKPRIIAEAFIGDDEDLDLKDYKFYCFSGNAKILFIASGRSSDQAKFDFYDIGFNHLDIQRPNTVNSKKGNEIPENYSKMVYLAEKLSGNLPHVRVDFYNINGRIYFGELTFFTGSGMKPFYPKKWDYILGDMLNLNNVSLKNH